VAPRRRPAGPEAQRVPACRAVCQPEGGYPGKHAASQCIASPNRLCSRPCPGGPQPRAARAGGTSALSSQPSRRKLAGAQHFGKSGLRCMRPLPGRQAGERNGPRAGPGPEHTWHPQRVAAPARQFAAKCASWWHCAACAPFAPASGPGGPGPVSRQGHRRTGARLRTEQPCCLRPGRALARAGACPGASLQAPAPDPDSARRAAGWAPQRMDVLCRPREPRALPQGRAKPLELFSSTCRNAAPRGTHLHRLGRLRLRFKLHHLTSHVFSLRT